MYVLLHFSPSIIIIWLVVKPSFVCIFWVVSTTLLFTSVYRSDLAHNLYVFVEWMNGALNFLTVLAQHHASKFRTVTGSCQGLFFLFPWDTLISFFIVVQVCAVYKSGLILYERITFDYHCKHSSQCLIPRNSWISLFLLFEVSSTTRK